LLANLEQKHIQHWIERIPRHIQEVIALEGGNAYREGSEERARRFDWRKEAELTREHTQIRVGETVWIIMDEFEEELAQSDHI